MNNESLKWYLHAAEAGKIDAELFYKIGICYDEQDNQEEAFKWYLKSAETGKVNKELFYKIGCCFEKSGNKKVASEWYLKSVNIGNVDKNLFYKLGFWFEETGNKEKALLWYEKSADSGKVDGELFYKIGVLYQNNGDEKESIKWFKRSAEEGNDKAQDVVEEYQKNKRKSLIIKISIACLVVLLIGTCVRIINESIKRAEEARIQKMEKDEIERVVKIAKQILHGEEWREDIESIEYFEKEAKKSAQNARIYLNEIKEIPERLYPKADMELSVKTAERAAEKATSAASNAGYIMGEMEKVKTSSKAKAYLTNIQTLWREIEEAVKDAQQAAERAAKIKNDAIYAKQEQDKKDAQEKAERDQRLQRYKLTTGLYWVRSDNWETWEDARSYCAKYNKEGLSNWRLPTEQEYTKIRNRETNENFWCKEEKQYYHFDGSYSYQGYEVSAYTPYRFYCVKEAK